MSINRIVSIALAAMTLAACADDRPIVEPRDSVKEGMSLVEATAILGPPNDRVQFFYSTARRNMTIEFRNGTASGITVAPPEPIAAKAGMTEPQVVALMGKPDRLIRTYGYGSQTSCDYSFEQDRLVEALCFGDTPLARRFETIALGSSRRTVEHYFGTTPEAKAYVYGASVTSDPPGTFVWFSEGRIRAGDAQAGMTQEEVLRQRGRPIDVCDSYDDPKGSAGWTFCYDNQARLVSKSWNPAYANP
jgi:hypothetical protein